MRRSLSLIGLVSLALMASCSSNPSFDQRWSSTPAPMAPNPDTLLAGKWEGTWQSDSNDYHGHLQSIIAFSGPEIKDKKEVKEYMASFEMRLFEIPFKSYDVDLSATPMPDGRIHFEGIKDLGFYDGGLFRYEGYIDPSKDELFCEYNSDKDTGTFKMRRITLENK